MKTEYRTNPIELTIGKRRIILRATMQLQDPHTGNGGIWNVYLFADGKQVDKTHFVSTSPSSACRNANKWAIKAIASHYSYLPADVLKISGKFTWTGK